MAVWLAGLCFLLGTTAQQPAQPPLRVELSASTTTPFIGQVIDVTLRLRGTPPPGELTLHLPWLLSPDPRYTWRIPPEAWVCQHARPRLNGLKLRWQQHTLTAPETAPGVYELHWQMILEEPTDANEPLLRLAPAQVADVRSRPLLLEVQRPSLSNAPGFWALGVGRFQISAAWQPARVVLGQETRLALTVRGDGDLTRIPAPALATLPGWERDAFLLEPLPETWEHQATRRVFRFRVRPRRLGTLTAPGVLARGFDPASGRVQTQLVAVPPLDVVSSLATTANPGRLYGVDDARLALPEEARAYLRRREEVRPVVKFVNWTAGLLWLPVLTAAAVVARAALGRYRPGWWERFRRRRATRRALRRLDRLGADLTPARLYDLLAAWLCERHDRPAPHDRDALRAELHALHLGEPFAPLLRHLEEWEFGPHVPHRPDEVRALASRLLGEARG